MTTKSVKFDPDTEAELDFLRVQISPGRVLSQSEVIRGLIHSAYRSLQKRDVRQVDFDFSDFDKQGGKQ